MTKINYTLTITPRFSSRIRENADVISALNEFEKQLNEKYIISAPNGDTYTVEVVFGLSAIHVVLRDGKERQLRSASIAFKSEAVSQNVAVSIMQSIGDVCSEIGKIEAASMTILAPAVTFMDIFCQRIRSA